MYVKFVKEPIPVEETSHFARVVQCQSYVVDRRHNGAGEKEWREIGAFVILYPGMTQEDGVEYCVGRIGHPDYQHLIAWVMNDNGETIDKIGPFD